jgi:hypothetical protein
MRAQGLSAMRSGGLMKPKLLVQFLVVAMMGFLSANLSAQAPKKFVFVNSVGGPPPPATNSSVFAVPAGVAIGPDQTDYVADPQHNQVVAFHPNGTTQFFNSLPCPSTVVGCVINPWTLHGPTYVAVAPNGNVWISDTMNDVVVEVNPSGTVVAFAGVGPNAVAYTTVCGGSCPPRPNSGQGPGQFYGPGALAVDKLGNVYVADWAGGYLLGNNAGPYANIRIEKFASSGTFLTAWGSWCNLNTPGSFVTDANGYDWFCNNFARGGLVLGDGQLNYVTGLAVDDSLNVYVADAGNNRVQKFTSWGLFLLKWGGLPVGAGDGQFNQPGGIAVDLDQSVYVVDGNNNRIEQFDGFGNFLSKGGSKGTFEAQFDNPFGIATVPPYTALTCLLFGPTLSDCTHGMVVSEIGHSGGTNGNTRVQFLAARPDQDKDGITDEIDASPNTFSNDFNNTSLGTGFNTGGSIVNRGNQTFAIYGELSPTPVDQIRIRTETFGGATPLTVTLCATKTTLSFPAGTGVNFTCQNAGPSTPAVVAEEGPVGFQFVGSDGTIATATLSNGADLWVDPSASTIHDLAGTIVVNLSNGKSVTLTPGQSVLVHTWVILTCPYCKVLPPPPPPICTILHPC